jgi:flavorubredoxin
MVRALVLYHSLFGNTRDIAYSLAYGIRKTGIQTDLLSINEIDLNSIPDYDFLAVGGPTHMIGLSKDMKEFLIRLKSVNLRSKKGFSFDTRNPSRMNKKKFLILENSAARRIEARLKRMKLEIIFPRQSAIVYGREGPLQEDVAGRFTKIGMELGTMLKS